MSSRLLTWNNALTSALLLTCIVLALLLARADHATIAPQPRAPIGRAVALKVGQPELPDFAVHDELLARRIPVSALTQSKTFGELIKAVEDAAHCPILLNWKAAEGLTLEPKTPFKPAWNPNHQWLVEVRLDEAIEWIINSSKGVSLAYVVEDGRILLSSEDDLAQHTLSLVYDPRDLIDAEMALGYTRVEAMEHLHRAIVDTVDRASWNESGGTVGSMQIVAGLFVITQTASNHRHILEFLQDLRDKGALQKKSQRDLPVRMKEQAPDTRSNSGVSILRRSIGGLTIQDVKLEAAMDQVADAAKIKIYVDWKSLEPVMIKKRSWAKDYNIHESISIGEAIRLLLVPDGSLDSLAIEEEDGGLAIALRLSTELYDVRDLLTGYSTAARQAGDARPTEVIRAEGADHLRELIANSADRTSWVENSGSLGSISEFAGILAVTQSSVTQTRVAGLLEKLRKTGLTAPLTGPGGNHPG